MNMRQHRKARHLGMQHYIQDQRLGYSPLPHVRHTMAISGRTTLKALRRKYLQPAYAPIRARLSFEHIRTRYWQKGSGGTFLIFVNGSEKVLRSRPLRCVMFDESTIFDPEVADRVSETGRTNLSDFMGELGMEFCRSLGVAYDSPPRVTSWHQPLSDKPVINPWK